MNTWGFSFHFLKIFLFLDLDGWDTFFFKTLGQPRKVKNGAIMLKFVTIVDWMNT